jgi:hypothetical protein
MSFGSQQPAQPQPFGISDQMTCSQQQAVPVAFIAGTRKISVQAMSQVYNLNIQPAPNTVPQKK